MITLSPDEEAAYKKSGIPGAVSELRRRTGLGLGESMRIVKEWIATGGKIEGLSEAQKHEAALHEKLSEALLRAQKAERALNEYKWAALQVALEVANKVSDEPEPEQDTYGRACHEIISALQKLKKEAK